MGICSELLDCDLLTAEEKVWVENLLSPEYGQQHIMENIKNVNNIKQLVKQLSYTDKTYPGGLLRYIKESRRLLKESAEGINGFEGYVPTVPLTELLITGSEEFNKAEMLGLNELHKLAFVLVAGGLGERLGYPYIKVSLSVESVTKMTYLEYYAKLIQACQSKSQIPTIKLPFVIMTSDDTHTPTLELLENNKYFGLEKDQVILLKQEKVPALLDNDARLALSEKESKYNLIYKPHGHGDIHTLLRQKGLPKKWAQEGKKWCLFFQDTNSLVAHALAPLIGVSVKYDLVFNTLVVPRKPGEAIGAICRLIHPTLQELTLNVEYNHFSSLLTANNITEEILNGYSKYPGNTNVLLFNIPRYAEILEKSHGFVPEFINPKYTDNTKMKFKSAARLECMMQDLPRVFSPNDKIGCTQLDRWLCFSTVKNNNIDAINKIKLSENPECVLSGEADYYYANAKLLEIACKQKFGKCTIAPPTYETYSNVTYPIGPKIIIFPNFGFALKQIKDRIINGDIEILPNSALILNGDINIRGLYLDGALNLQSSNGSILSLKNLRIINQGIKFKPIEKSLSPRTQTRGYDTEKKEVSEIVV